MQLHDVFNLHMPFLSYYYCLINYRLSCTLKQKFLLKEGVSFKRKCGFNAAIVTIYGPSLDQLIKLISLSIT